MTLTLDLIRNCLEGAVPAVLATCDPDGMPNVSMVSQLHYVDPERLAISYQFFNKTRRNLLATGWAAVDVCDAATGATYRLDLDFETTETDGPLFEAMKARLAGIASHTGMDGVFRLLGADVFRVRAIAQVPGPVLTPPPALAGNALAATRRTCEAIAAPSDLGALLDATLACLRDHFAIRHAMILMLDAAAGRLYAVATCGYDRSGVGWEVAVGEGVIGVAAREGVPIRIGHMTSEYRYGTAIRSEAAQRGVTWEERTAIPFPGLAAPESQVAVPIRSATTTLGVLFAESPQPLRFGHADEDALALIAGRLGSMITLVQQADAATPGAPGAEAAEGRHPPVTVRHYPVDDSVFLDNDYLIKGVAGAIFRKLVREHLAGRVEFTNRELRLDPALRLPEQAENLEARLVLLERRLRERGAPIRLQKSGRGRFHLVVACTLTLEEMPDPAARTA